MIIWLKEILMQILIWMLGFIDCIFNVFRAIAGLDTVTTTKGEQSISEYFLHLDGVQWAFWVVFVASIGICAVCTVVAIVKNMINAKGGEHKSHVRTVGQAISTTVISIFMATILIVGMSCADKLLLAMDRSINHGEKTIMSHEIIDISINDGFLFDNENLQGFNKYDEDTGELTFVSYLYYFDADGDGKPRKDPSNPNKILWQDDKGTLLDNVYKEIKDETGNPVFDAAGYPTVELIMERLVPRRSAGGWLIKSSAQDFIASSGGTDLYYSTDDLANNFWDERVSHILGDHNSFLIPIGWKYDGLVDPDSFNFLIAYICSIVILIAIVSAMFGLVKRLFDIVLLFIALPGIAATIPLDDGAKFKLWRETVISKIFLAFGTVLAVNIFTIIAPQVWGISMSANAFTNSVLKLVLICGGALTISGGQLLFARLLGTSAEESREMGQSARTLMGGAATAWGGAKAGGRLLFGTKNANGQRVGGLIKGGASAVGTIGMGAVNTVGGALGGQAYKNSKIRKGVSATQQALQGFGRSAGWIMGGNEQNTNLGYGVSAGTHKIGSKIGKSKAVQNTGLNNGIIGAIRKPIDERHVAAQERARGMLAQGNTALGDAYSAAAAAEAAKSKALPIDFGGREVLPGFENGVPSTLPAPIPPSAPSSAQKATGKKE